jgi:hypothetical protein
VTARRVGGAGGGVAAPITAPRWGLGDAFVGYVASQALSLAYRAGVLVVLA